MTTQYWIAVPSDGVYHVMYHSGGQKDCKVALESDTYYQLSCGQETDPYLVQIDGLVSGGRMLNLSGGAALTVLTDPAQLESVTCLHGTESVVSMKTDKGGLDVVRQLAAKIATQIGFRGEISVERVLDGGVAQIGIGTYPCLLSASVYAYLSDWTDSSLKDLSALSLDELIYKEV